MLINNSILAVSKYLSGSEFSPYTSWSLEYSKAAVIDLTTGKTASAKCTSLADILETNHPLFK